MNFLECNSFSVTTAIRSYEDGDVRIDLEDACLVPKIVKLRGDHKRVRCVGGC